MLSAKLPQLQQVVAIADRASALAMAMLQAPWQSHTKEDNSPVTAIDLAIDRFLRRELRALMPAAAWLSEETADRPDRLQCSYVWVVDPIDGTRSLIAGRPEFCVSIALVQSGVGPLLGVIANPSTGERFLAEHGSGARNQNGKVLKVKDYDATSPALLVSRTDKRTGLWDGVAPDGWMTKMGGLAYKMGLVAAGAYDGHATPTPRSEWDAAAGVLIVQQAGGISTDVHGRPLRFNQPRPHFDGFVVASQMAHAPLLQLVQGSVTRWHAVQTRAPIR